jgi:hypothetical protein
MTALRTRMMEEMKIRQHSQQKTMTLSADEFIRRFLLHVSCPTVSIAFATTASWATATAKKNWNSVANF